MRTLLGRKTSIRNHKGIVVAKKMSRKVSRRVVRPACIAGVRISRELQSSVRSDEVVVATEQLQVLIKPLRRASVSVRLERYAELCRIVRFNHSMNDVFHVEESSELLSACESPPMASAGQDLLHSETIDASAKYAP